MREGRGVQEEARDECVRQRAKISTIPQKGERAVGMEVPWDPANRPWLRSEKHSISRKIFCLSKLKQAVTERARERERH